MNALSFSSSALGMADWYLGWVWFRFCGSSALVGSVWLLLAMISPCRRHYFLLSEKKVCKETDTESFSAPSNPLLFLRISSYSTSMCWMSLSQTSCLGFAQSNRWLGKTLRWCWTSTESDCFLMTVLNSILVILFDLKWKASNECFEL